MDAIDTVGTEVMRDRVIALHNAECSFYLSDQSCKYEIKEQHFGHNDEEEGRTEYGEEYGYYYLQISYYTIECNEKKFVVEHFFELEPENNIRNQIDEYIEINGLKEGLLTCTDIYNNQNEILEKRTYKNGKLNGEYLSYSNGNIVRRMNYVDDKPDGKSINFDSKGNIITYKSTICEMDKIFFRH